MQTVKGDIRFFSQAALEATRLINLTFAVDLPQIRCAA